MNLFAEMEARLTAIVAELVQAGQLPDMLDVPRLTVEPPPDGVHGDMATNAAMVLAKPAAMEPRALADLLAARLAEDDRVAASNVAAPGFVNLTLKPKSWHDLVPHVLRVGSEYGAVAATGNKVNIEFVSANPTGPMHVGHARGAVFGDALARLLKKTSTEVLREYYINDAGAQVDILARSALLRMRESLGEDIGEIPAGLYPGEYLQPVGQALAKKHGKALFEQDEAVQIKAAREMALPMMMAMIRTDLAALGVTHDCLSSEQDLHDGGAVAAVVDTLTDKGLIYEGVLQPPKGKKPPSDWEATPQTLFRATQFGDDSDRPLKKSDGSWTYFAADIAYHADKIKRGYVQMIDVWGADHVGYVKRMQLAIAALTDGQADLQVKLCNLVKLKRGDKEVKMSKRSGDLISLHEVVDEVGKDAIRFMMLTRKNDAPLDFDFELVKEKHRDNPVFYVQYAHARICSVMRQAQEMGFTDKELADAALAKADISLLVDAAELALLKDIAFFPRMLVAAAETLEPHRIAFYVQLLAGQFHRLWTLGKEKPDLRFLLESNKPLTLARLALLRATALTIAAGLDVMGIEAETEMR